MKYKIITIVAAFGFLFFVSFCSLTCSSTKIEIPFSDKQVLGEQDNAHKSKKSYLLDDLENKVCCPEKKCEENEQPPCDTANENTILNKTPMLNNVPEDMLGVPGGKFTMGLNSKRAILDERHEHLVTIKPFLLDKTEVTNKAYFECVQAKICKKPKRSQTQKSGFEKEHKFRTSTRPISSISQKDAQIYCKWKGKRLPTEPEFERAARGNDNRMYAWGNEEPSLKLSVYRQKITAPVGSKPKGAGPYGHLDLSGNVWEWTSSLYDPHAYIRDTANAGISAECNEILKTQNELRKKKMQGFTGTNPIPTECEFVLRGGAFNYFSWGLRASNRVHHPGRYKMIMAGFRCAKNWPNGLTE